MPRKGPGRPGRGRIDHGGASRVRTAPETGRCDGVSVCTGSSSAPRVQTTRRTFMEVWSCTTNVREGAGIVARWVDSMVCSKCEKSCSAASTRRWKEGSPAGAAGARWARTSAEREETLDAVRRRRQRGSAASAAVVASGGHILSEMHALVGSAACAGCGTRPMTRASVPPRVRRCAPARGTKPPPTTPKEPASRRPPKTRTPPRRREKRRPAAAAATTTPCHLRGCRV